MSPFCWREPREKSKSCILFGRNRRIEGRGQNEMVLVKVIKYSWYWSGGHASYERSIVNLEIPMIIFAEKKHSFDVSVCHYEIHDRLFHLFFGNVEKRSNLQVYKATRRLVQTVAILLELDKRCSSCQLRTDPFKTSTLNHLASSRNKMANKVS